MRYGVILALHKTRPKGDFTVLRRVIPEYPPINIYKEIAEHKATGAYTHVWFQETTIPEDEGDTTPHPRYAPLATTDQKPLVDEYLRAQVQCPEPLQEGDEYRCRKCSIRWDTHEDKPECKGV